MALRNQEKFEQMGEFDGADTAVAEKPVAPAAPATAAPATANTAVVAAPKNAVAAPAKKATAALTSYQNVFEPGDVEFGMFDKITVSPAMFMLEDKPIGGDIELELLSWNQRWVASPGSDSEMAKKAAKYSIDGVHLDGEDTLLLDYVRQLRDVDGFPNAKVKEYLNVYGRLAFAEGKAIPPEDRPVVELQCSPETRKKFNAFRITHGINIKLGLCGEPEILKCKAHLGVNGSNKFGYATFSAG